MRTWLTTVCVLALFGCGAHRGSGGVGQQDTVRPSGRVADFGVVQAPAPANDGSEWSFNQVRSPADPGDAQKEPLSIEAFYTLKWMSSPQWSPSGDALVFELVNDDLVAGTSAKNLYLSSADGRQMRQLTNTDGSNHSPVWSPDGSQVLFVSDRNDKEPNLFVIPADGGEARALTHLATGVSSPTWAPDGRHVAFVSTVFPELGADVAANRARLEELDASVHKAHMAEDLLYRHWNFYKDGQQDHVMWLDTETGEITDLTPGDFESPVFSAGRGFAISPNSKEVCFVSNRDAPSAQAWTTNADLWVVPVAGGEPVNLTAANKAWDSEPVYSPDGRYIAFLRRLMPGAEADKARLALYDRQSGDITVLTEELDIQIVDFEWLPDSSGFVMSVQEKGRVPLYELTLADKKVQRLPIVPSVRQFQVGPDGSIVFTFEKISAPRELFVLAADRSRAIRLTAFNDSVVERYDFRPAEEMWIEGADGKKVHTFVVKPHGFVEGKKYPTILNVHGGPQTQWSDRLRGDWQVYPAHGYVVVFPNPHGSTGFGQEYTDAISRDWNGKVFEDLIKVTEAVAALDYVDADRMGAMGWSYGGYMMNWFAGHTDRFKALASMMGIFDLESFYYSTEELWFPERDVGLPTEHAEAYAEKSPSTYVNDFKTPMLVVTGEKDYRIPYTQSLMLFTSLRRRGVPAQLMVLPNDGHWPHRLKSMPLYYVAHLAWFERYLGGDAPKWTTQDLLRGRAFK